MKRIAIGSSELS